jgi:hypothetical protein
MLITADYKPTTGYAVDIVLTREKEAAGRFKGQGKISTKGERHLSYRDDDE